MLKCTMWRLIDHLRRAERAHDRGHLGQVALLVRVDHGVHHQPDLLLQRHLPQEILDAFVDGTSEVLIDVEASVFVQIAKGDAVDQQIRRILAQSPQVARRGQFGPEQETTDQRDQDSDQAQNGQYDGFDSVHCVLFSLRMRSLSWI